MIPKTLGVILLLFLLSRQKTASFGKDEIKDPYIPNDCQGDKLCSYDSAMDISEANDVQCCQGCSCDSQCHMYGICCPSVNESMQESDQFLNQSGALNSDLYNQTKHKKRALYPCVSMHYLLNRFRGIRLLPSQNEALRVVTDCPSDTGSHEYPKCNAPKAFEDFRLVSDEQGYVYRNEHCAKCHGVYNTTSWPLETQCNWLMHETFHSVEELKDFIVYNCKLKSLPPKNLTYLNEFSVCFSPATPSVGWCNASEDEKSVYSGKFTSHMSFSAILDNRKKNVPSKTHVCESSQMWDPYTAECRTVYCPTLTIPWQGECVDMFDSYSGFKLQVLFKILNWNHSLHVFAPLETSLTDIKARIVLDCFLCYVRFDLANNADVFLRVGLTSNENCTLNNLLYKLRRKKTIWIRGRGFKLKLELYMRQTKAQTILYNLQFNCDGGIFLTKELLQNCPRIKVPAMLVDEQVDNVLFENNLDNHAPKVICVEDYNSFMKSQKAQIGGQCMNRSDILLIVAIALALVCSRLS